MTQYQESIQRIGPRLKNLSEAIPGVMKGFHTLHAAALADGALSEKTKELIALAIGVAARCEGCVAFHVQALVRLGATRAEVEETLGVAILMGGGPSAMWSTEALAAFDEFLGQKS
ncbi:MAG: carboxymuconolactone decarboxylase family protein [Zoogloeaceae bacterium]|jgi:AhpD family alkylhydroperoxidase|nr:carboxymuconolactone decarboxylase family protein [Zoogloeaceae bacterium]